MLTPQADGYARRELTLPSLMESSLTDPFGHCPLSPAQTAGMQPLAKLWNLILSQLQPIIERNREPLGPLFNSLQEQICSQTQPFQTSWDILARSSATLRDQGHPDSQEVRDLFNGLHETALIASLLASYGTASFVTRVFTKVAETQLSEALLPQHIRRLYTHPLCLQALNAQLAAVDIESIRLAALTPTTIGGQRSIIERLCNSTSPQHSKERCLIDEGVRMLRSTSQLEERLLIGTAADHAPKLAARLSGALVGAPTGYVQSLGRGLGDTTLSNGSGNARIFVAPLNALTTLRCENPSQVLIYSPLTVDGAKITYISAQNLAQIRARFPDASLAVLRTDSSLFGVDHVLYQQAIDGTPSSITLGPTTPKLPSPITAVPETPAVVTSKVSVVAKPHKRSPIKVVVPKAKELFLFDQETLESLVPPATPPPVVALHRVDPATLPTTTAELNARLGITIIKPALVPRKDQLQIVFGMLEQPSFQWLIKANTGFGKTVLASIIMGMRLGNSPLTPAECLRGYRIGYVTPNVDLCAQAKAEFLRFLDLKDSEVAILHGKTSLKKREEIILDPANRIIVCTPETLLKTVAKAPAECSFDSLALLVVDEFQSAEGAHPMARLIREARAAGVPILSQSGTPARDAADLEEKRALLPLKGTLVPEALAPLKTHELLNSFLEPGILKLLREVASLSFAPYVSCREQLLNATSTLREITGKEARSLFDSRLTLKRKPHIESFAAPPSKTVKLLKAEVNKQREIQKSLQHELRAKGESLCERGLRAKTDLNLASINIARMSSLGSRAALLASAGRYAFLHDFSVTWIQRYLENPRREGAFPAFQDFFKKPEYRGIVRVVAEGTPFIHLLQTSSCAEALERAFNLPTTMIPSTGAQRRALFLNLALLEMSKRAGLDHPKEAALFARIEELHRKDQARGIIVFAEPRHLTKYLAIRLQHRFAALNLRTAFVTGEGDGFSDRLLSHLESLRDGFKKPPTTALGSWPEIRAAFQRSPKEAGERVDIIVATSRLSVGHDLSAAAEAHVYTMHADAQKLIQQIGRVGRPDGEDFFGRVGQCFYHVTRNTPEWYLFKSAIKKYNWMKNALTSSESWEDARSSSDTTDPAC